MEEIDSSLKDSRYQRAAQLCDLLLHSAACPEGIKKKKARALTGLGRMQTSANNRHYYLVCTDCLLQCFRRNASPASPPGRCLSLPKGGEFAP